MAAIELTDTRGGEIIANGNTVNPVAFNPSPGEYKLLCGIMCKLNNTCKK